MPHTQAVVKCVHRTLHESEHQQLDGEPVSDLQAFIMQCKDPPESGRFNANENSGAGCLMCCCSSRTHGSDEDTD